jgi:hypothetical protein
MRVDDDEALGLGLADRDEEARIGFLVDDAIRGLVGAENVAAHAIGTVAVVVFGVVERLPVGGPDGVAGGLAHELGIGAAVDVADGDVEIFRAVAVGGPREAGMGGVVLGAGEAEIAVSGLFVAVEQDLFLAAVARGAHQQGVLLAFEHARIVGPGTVRGGDAGIVFLHAPADLAIDRFAQILARLAELSSRNRRSRLRDRRGCRPAANPARPSPAASCRHAASYRHPRGCAHAGSR